ncbi:hypothetical protein NCS57_01272700 [Fusarium keratoplasticum]|uniref:Uncharacterized protein n=1 Tax=Fusarium keratoplasticum TaxID=1328300 RepID=A0ACC0QIU9_9HYPO|nr:hypothetical protein NCS57_01272700 [Fusarium keratoplasticum]KAI8655244.1 hypothetical protein NCS57_01272700 [Fusarium keratoplasticum]KAI8656076.1 hypothetical protein NCS55_01262000 [Fusarium keratoplasticum]
MAGSLRLLISISLYSLLFQTAIASPRAASKSHDSSPSVKWGACPKEVLPGVDCGTIDVPIAYHKGNSTTADGDKTVRLALTRLNHTGKADKPKQGTLFFNPGGPGVSAAFLVSAAGTGFVSQLEFSKDLRENYDIIGLDPRGAGFSTQVQCDPNIFNERVATFVEDEAGYKKLLNYSRRLGESCTKLTGPLINHLDSIHAAKDHELVRRALGSPKFNLLGLSYGTLIGTQYLNLFPETVGRMSLDGLVDLTQSETMTLLTETVTYETTLNKFFDWCDHNSTCALHGKNASHTFDQILARADSKPIPAPGCKKTCRSNVTGEEIRSNVQNFLIFVDLPLGDNWIALGEALAEASKGNATALSTTLQTSRIATDLTGESPYAYLAIGCQEWKHQSRSATDFKQKLLTASVFAPRTRGASQSYYYQSTCIGWPAPVTDIKAPSAKSAKEAPTVLLANSVYDPDTSVAWAQSVREQLDHRVSITRNGYGHTSFYLHGDTSKALETFLASGKLPKDGTVYKT